MGANAQTSVPAFTAGQVLTAQQQTEINTGIPVFATTTTRDAAFGGTGEKTLAEGQFAYIEATNTTQYYDGAAWQTANGGLVLIKTQTIGTAVSSVSVTNAFSTDYDAYKIVISGGVGSTSLELRMTLGASSTGYYIAGNGIGFTGAAYNLYQSNAAYWTAGTATTNVINLIGELVNPYLAKYTYIYNAAYVGATGSNELNGFHGVATSYTDFTLTTSTGTLTGGTIHIYGYQN